MSRRLKTVPVCYLTILVALTTSTLLMAGGTHALSQEKPSAQARPAQGGAASASSLNLVELVVARNVTDREPEGAAERFPADAGTLWAFARISNAATPTPVSMVWKREGKERARLTVTVGKSRRWRTWTRKRVLPRDAGHWTVELVAADGRVLGTTSFELAASAKP